MSELIYFIQGDDRPDLEASDLSPEARAVYGAFGSLERQGLGPTCFYLCVYCLCYFTPWPKDPDEDLDLLGYPVDGCPGCCDVSPEGLLAEREFVEPGHDWYPYRQGDMVSKDGRVWVTASGEKRNA